MSNKRIYIILIVFGFALWGAPTCEDSDPWENTKVESNGKVISDEQLVLQSREELIGSIEKEFGSKYLNEENFDAFEERAKEKLMDFADYLSIYANKNYDEAFIDQARKMILGLFMNEKNIKVNLLATRDEDSLHLEDFLTKVKNFSYDSTRFNITQVRVSDTLKLIDNGIYKGGIAFSSEIYGLTSQKRILISTSMNKIEVIVTRSDKSFGNNKIRIWGVHFGNVQ